MIRHNGKSGLEMVKMLNKLDLVEVVRCKDCKYWLDSDEACEMFASRLSYYTKTDKHWTADNGYCFLGERKESEE